MTLIQAAQYVSDAGALLLLLRMLRPNFQFNGVFGVFCVFVGFHLLDSIASLVEYALRDLHLVDYRISYISTRAIGWVVSGWLVYALVSSMLKTLPGILRFSKLLLNGAFALAIFLALLTVRPEIGSASYSRYTTPLSRAVVAWYALDRAISMALLLVIIAVLVFILWFPVSMPRNLAVLSIGLVVYFGVGTAVLLMRSYWVNNANSQPASIAISFLLAACFGYWLIFLTPGGQAVDVRLGHSWSLGKQEQLLGQLESMNTALLRSARR